MPLESITYGISTYELQAFLDVTAYPISPHDVKSGNAPVNNQNVLWRGRLLVSEQNLTPTDPTDYSNYQLEQRLRLELKLCNGRKNDDYKEWAIVYYNPILFCSSTSWSEAISLSPKLKSFYYFLAQLPVPEGTQAEALSNDTTRVALGVKFATDLDAIQFREVIASYDRRFKSAKIDLEEKLHKSHTDRVKSTLPSLPSPSLSLDGDFANSPTVSNSDEEDEFDNFVSAS